nr:gustatory receptor 32 [Papilio xuthus]
MISTLNSQNEILLDNFVDKDIQMFLRPLNLLNYVTLSTKYSIKYNFITSNSYFTNFISLIICMSFIIIYLSAIFLNDYIFKLDIVSLTLLMVNFFLYAFGYLLNTFLNVVNSDVHVYFIIKIKNIKKFITNDIDCKILTLTNWIYVFFSFITHIVIVLIQILISRFELYYTFVVVILLINDFNTIYIIRIIKLLRIVIDSWTLKLKEEKQLNIEVINDETRQKRYWDVTRKTFSDIIEASCIYKQLCQIQITYHIVIMFMQLLNNVQYMITSTTFNVLIFILLIWTIKNIILLISISYECEMLYISLKNTQVLFLKSIADKKCTAKLACIFFTAFERLAYKSLRRESRYSPLVTCGILTVDASLPLRFLSVLTTYTALLLQIPFS